MKKVVVATRSTHKLEEIRQLASSIPRLRLVSLKDVGIPPDPVEDSIEQYDTFERNALAKARHFASLVSAPVLADDSGLCVDALGGAPGVRSKRFSNRNDLDGEALDRANNEQLLEALRAVPPDRRSARFVCAVAIVTPEGEEHLFRGSVEGFLLDRPAGAGGFGYDPLFYLPELNATFAEVPQAEKNRRSHRARAVEAALPLLRRLVAPANPPG